MIRRVEIVLTYCRSWLSLFFNGYFWLHGKIWVPRQSTKECFLRLSPPELHPSRGNCSYGFYHVFFWSVGDASIYTTSEIRHSKTSRAPFENEKVWAVYLLVLEMSGQRPKVYVGSGTAETKGAAGRIGHIGDLKVCSPGFMML